MTEDFSANDDSPQRKTLALWRAMSFGPIAFLLSLLSIGLMFILLDAVIPAGSSEPSDETVLIGALFFDVLGIWLPILGVIGAEIWGAIVAYRMRRALAGTLFETHAASAIRTFWVMVGGFVAANVLTLSLLMIPNINAIGFGVGGVMIVGAVVPLLFVWKTYRVVRGWRQAKAALPL